MESSTRTGVWPNSPHMCYSRTHMDMQVNLRHQVLRASQRLLRPVVALLLRSGITWKEFSDLSKAVFVQVATENYGRKGRPTNVSRVAILTGLSRREVTRQRRHLDADVDVGGDAQISYAARVLSAWHQDPDFLDDTGEPLALPREGEHPSVASLLKRYAGDIPHVALYKELLSVAAIATNDDGLVEARTRYYMPAPLDPNAVLRAGGVWQDLGENINYNLLRDADQPGRFEGRATNARVNPKALGALRELIDQKAQSLLEETDQWLSDNESADESEGVRAGLGIYLIDDSRSK